MIIYYTDVETSVSPIDVNAIAAASLILFRIAQSKSYVVRCYPRHIDSLLQGCTSVACAAPWCKQHQPLSTCDKMHVVDRMKMGHRPIVIYHDF